MAVSALNVLTWILGCVVTILTGVISWLVRGQVEQSSRQSGTAAEIGNQSKAIEEMSDRFSALVTEKAHNDFKEVIRRDLDEFKRNYQLAKEEAAADMRELKVLIGQLRDTMTSYVARTEANSGRISAIERDHSEFSRNSRDDRDKIHRELGTVSTRLDYMEKDKGGCR